VLLSDGASRLVDLFELATWEELLALLDENGPDELLRQVRAAEAVDPKVASGPGPSAATTPASCTWSSPDGCAWDELRAALVVGASFSRHAKGGGI
jgi:hypothetical protein